MEIQGTTAVVSGGASGLGAATAVLLAEQGASVAIVDVDERNGSAVARDVGGTFVHASVADEGAVDAAFRTIQAALGIPRILVNCAGIAPSINLLRGQGLHPLDAFTRTIEVNLIGTFLMIRQFANCLTGEAALGEECGVIINTASIAALAPMVALAPDRAEIRVRR